MPQPKSHNCRWIYRTSQQGGANCLGQTHSPDDLSWSTSRFPAWRQARGLLCRRHNATARTPRARGNYLALIHASLARGSSPALFNMKADNKTLEIFVCSLVVFKIDRFCEHLARARRVSIKQTPHRAVRAALGGAIVELKCQLAAAWLALRSKKLALPSRMPVRVPCASVQLRRSLESEDPQQQQQRAVQASARVVVVHRLAFTPVDGIFDLVRGGANQDPNTIHLRAPEVPYSCVQSALDLHLILSLHELCPCSRE